jgi:hypothetical protein
MPPAPPPVVTTASQPGLLQISLPANAIDLSTSTFALAPYGYHGVDHAADGHPGWDIELRFGSPVRAAAEGEVQSIGPDTVTPGRMMVKVETILGNHVYRIVYGNLTSVADDVAEGETVRRGQVLGTAGAATMAVVGAVSTSSMVHFQVDDFEYYREIPEPNAVGLEIFLTADGKQAFDRQWAAAWFPQEITEPFASNPRAAVFPMVRTWRRESGLGPMGITFTRRSLRDTEYEYQILAESGTTVETGRAVATFGRPYSSLNLISPTGTRLGVYDIVDDQMRLALGSPGATRPVDLSEASVYRTSRSLPSN